MSSVPEAPAFRRIALLGLGLMGGSLGLALKSRFAGSPGEGGVEVVGWNRTPARVAEALSRGVVDEGAATVTEAVAEADLIVVATPVSTIAEIALAAAQAAGDDTVITDVGSVKRVIVDTVGAGIATGPHFVGGHPMCGSELSGLDAARADLYEGATWVLTPTALTDHEAFMRLQALIRSLGARVLAVDPRSHDEFVAVVSHLPHLAAASLLNVAKGQAVDSEALLHLAAGGFRDVTRIASGSPDLWADICAANSDAISGALTLLISHISDLKDAIADGRTDAIAEVLESAREVRAALPVPATAKPELYQVVVPVPDRPGILAEVSMLVGRLGINIEDIAITHSVEGSQGLLELLIEGEDAADRVMEALRTQGYLGAIRLADGEVRPTGGGGAA